jgi:hypothetical protein
MPAKRQFWASLLAAFLLLGTFELHAPGEVLERFGHAENEAFSASAVHPGQPAHFEQYLDGKRAPCPLCLHQLRTSGAHLLAAAGLDSLAAQPALRGDLRLPAGHLARASSGARAPPLA